MAQDDKAIYSRLGNIEGKLDLLLAQVADNNRRLGKVETDAAKNATISGVVVSLGVTLVSKLLMPK